MAKTWTLTIILLSGGLLAADREESLDHWAFRPLAPVTVPALDAPTAIDAFLGERLAAAGLRPSPDADPVRLARRLWLVLHGMPPSPEELADAVAHVGPGAYERLVDTLLASPRFGERMARWWLDVARYAESNGYETNRPRPNAYPYRDWVIEAFNSDLPYDRFVSLQIAGDVEGVDAPTGFLVAGPVDIVKSPDRELTLMQRADELDDFVNATSTAFLGLTVSCARCHDHKFDPIGQTDYYSLAAVFSGVEHADRVDRIAKAGRQPADAGGIEARIAELRAELGRLGLREPVDPRTNEERFEPTPARFVRFSIAATNTAAEPCIDELEVWTHAAGGAPENVALASAGAKAGASGTLPGYEIHQLAHLNDGRYGNGRSWISATPGAGWVTIELAAASTIDRIVWGRDREGRFSDRVPTRYVIECALEPGEWRQVASSRERITPGATRLDEGAEVAPDVARRANAILGELAERGRELEELRREADPLVWGGRFGEPRPVHLLSRGDPLQPQDLVPPGAIAAFGSLGVDGAAGDAARRVALARWIASADHPLTARVIVNRLWQHIFGEGIVSTPNDFGTRGVPPSHPQLLDWLAGELIRSGWSMRHIVREIVLSHAFRQSSAPHDAGLRADGKNRLLWRYTPRRLSAEAIRDSILAVSGALDLRMGGPGYEVVVALPGNVYAYEVKREFTRADWRRGIYAHAIRGELDATFGAFDCPDGGQVAPKRARSTTPLQALNLLNAPFVVEQAETFARRAQRKAPGDADAAAMELFRRAFGREPDADEVGWSRHLVAEHGLAALARVVFNANEFLFID